MADRAGKLGRAAMEVGDGHLILLAQVEELSLCFDQPQKIDRSRFIAGLGRVQIVLRGRQDFGLEDSDLAVRRFDPSRFDEEIRTYLELYNRSLEGNWGFTPLQEGEVKQIAEELRHVLAPEFAAFAMVDGKAVGAVLALLDYNQIIRRLNGRLLPFGIFRLLWGKKRIDVARAMAVTMLPDFQQSGFGIVLLDQLVEAAKPWGLKRWEFSWVLESNTSSRGTLERAGTKLSKTYRIYDREL